MQSAIELRTELLSMDLGYGLMGLTWRQVPVQKDIAFKTLEKVIQLSGNKSFFNIGEFYGPDFINLKYTREFFEKHPDKRSQVIISCKGGVDNETLKPCGLYKSVCESIENSLREIGGPIEIFQVARIDTELIDDVGFPTETFDAIVKYIKLGKIGGISLSEVNESQICAIYEKYGEYITCVEVELSLFSTDILSNGVAKVCNDLGIPIICYSPLGRGLLTGKITNLNDVPDGDFRKILKRFSNECIKNNLTLTHFLEHEIISKRCENNQITLSQLSISWIKSWNHIYTNTNFLPIPGGTTSDKIADNFTRIPLTNFEIVKINNFLESFRPSGDRYEVVI